MDENIDQNKQDELNAWIKKQLNGAVQKLMKQGGVDGLLVEAKPAWVLPFQILIGEIRPQGRSGDSQWCICGEVPTDFLHSSIAASAREVLRHFSMKWQLAAARHAGGQVESSSQSSNDPSEDDPVIQLAGHAEALYELVEDDRLWMQESQTT